MTLKDKHFAGEDVINGKQLLRSEKRLDITQTAEHPLHVRPGRRYEATGREEGGLVRPERRPTDAALFHALGAMTSELMLLKLTASCESRERELLLLLLRLHSDGNDAVRLFPDQICNNPAHNDISACASGRKTCPKKPQNKTPKIP